MIFTSYATVDPLYKPHPQVVVSLLVFNLLHLLNLVPLRGYSRALGERLLVPAVCDGAQAVLATWAQAKGSVDGDGLFPLALRLLPLVAAGWSHALRLAAPPSARLTGLVAVLSVGVSLAVTGRGTPHIFGGFLFPHLLFGNLAIGHSRLFKAAQSYISELLS